jgi:hypothetical protein
MAKKRSTKAKKKPSKKRQKMTPNQAAFAKQQQRIRRFIKSAEKRGYSFPANAVPERPARVTKRDIARITAIKPETLYEQATFIYEGSTFTGTEGRMIERSLGAQKGALHKREKDPRYHTQPGMPPAEATDVADRVKEALDRFNQGKSEYEQTMEEIDSWTPDGPWNAWFAEKRRQQVDQMKRMIYAAIQNFGFSEAMRAIGRDATAFHNATQTIMFDSKQEAVQNAFNALAEILKGSALSAEESADLEILNDAVNGYQDEEIEV